MVWAIIYYSILVVMTRLCGHANWHPGLPRVLIPVTLKCWHGSFTMAAFKGRFLGDNDVAKSSNSFSWGALVTLTPASLAPAVWVSDIALGYISNSHVGNAVG